MNMDIKLLLLIAKYVVEKALLSFTHGLKKPVSENLVN